MSTLNQERRAHPMLALKLVAGRGAAKLGMIRLAAEGSGMARALALGDPSLGAARWRAAERCRIALRGDGWLISNHSRQLVCALNGHRLLNGEEAVVQAGDVLEMDLLRFLVVADPGVHQWSDALSRLEIGRGATRRVDTTRHPGATPGDLLDHLHDEFIAAATDPLQLAGHSEWRGTTLAASEEAPTIEELCSQAMPFPLLRDVLLPRAGIDQVIEGFESFGATDPAHVANREDVLRLFAPEIEYRSARQLPSLTRREHHAVSIDSAMMLGAVRPGADRADR